MSNTSRPLAAHTYKGMVVWCVMTLCVGGCTWTCACTDVQSSGAMAMKGSVWVVNRLLVRVQLVDAAAGRTA